MSILISYIIPVYNDLGNSITLIKDIVSKDQNKFEILLIDDGSKKKLECNMDNVKVIRNEINGGPSVARNLGALNASGKYLFFIDSDIFISLFNRNLLISEIQNNASDVIMGVYNPVSPYSDIYSIYKNLYWSYNQINVLNNHNNFCTAIFIINKNLFIHLGLLNEKLRIGEDREFGERIISKGYKFYSKKQFIGDHYKRFNFISLLNHHFLNSLSISEFFLNKILNKFKRKKINIKTKNYFLSNYLQLITIPSSIIILLGSTLVIFDYLNNKIGLAIITIFSFIFFFSIKNFISFVRTFYGIKILPVIIVLYFVEQIVAFFGLSYMVIKIFFNNFWLNLKSKLYSRK